MRHESDGDRLYSAGERRTRKRRAVAVFQRVATEEIKLVADLSAAAEEGLKRSILNIVALHYSGGGTNVTGRLSEMEMTGLRGQLFIAEYYWTF